MNWTHELLVFFIELLIIVGVFAALSVIGKFTVDKLSKNDSIKSFKLFNLQEYFPEEQISILKQVYYLAMILIFVIEILYILIYPYNDLYNFYILDIIVSLYLVICFRNDSRKWVLISLIPFGSLSFLLFNYRGLVSMLDIFHIVGFLYFIKLYYHKFIDYTETNRLGITILLLFSIVFISFFVTIIVEDVTPLDSLVMVSNAFTSNGYSILGKSSFGKVNSIILVWSGFLLSGVGTATLTVALVMQTVNNKFDKLEDMVKKNK